LIAAEQIDFEYFIVFAIIELRLKTIFSKKKNSMTEKHCLE
jgi:hypothetical protein